MKDTIEITKKQSEMLQSLHTALSRAQSHFQTALEAVAAGHDLPDDVQLSGIESDPPALVVEVPDESDG